MTKVAVSGASGSLGRHITNFLLNEIPAENLTLVTRTPEKVLEAAKGKAKIAKGDYNSFDDLVKAYEGADSLMIISGIAVTKRIPEHRNAIAAAKKAGIKHIVYTSVAGIHPQNPTLSAKDHAVTENDLRESGLGYTIFRDATYTEAITALFGQTAIKSGEWIMIEGNKKIAPVSRRDIALCAAKCLTNPDFHNGAIYELSGPELLTFQDMCEITSKFYNTNIKYRAVSVEERYAIWDSLGVPRSWDSSLENPNIDNHSFFSEEMVTAEVAFQDGYHEILTGHVEFITGKKPHSLLEVLEFTKGKPYTDC